MTFWEIISWAYICVLIFAVIGGEELVKFVKDVYKDIKFKKDEKHVTWIDAD